MIKPYFQTELGKLYHGDCLETLKQMSDEGIDCVMTSPPYWALRDYGIEPEIWDGNKDCKHEWSKVNNAGDHRYRAGNNTSVGNCLKEEIWQGNSQSDFCLKCGAWKGSLGLEPIFQLYIQHLIQIFNEIKRVLKKTGTCWVNIGDTYSGSGGDHKEWHKNDAGFQGDSFRGCKPTKTNLQNKSLCQIPERFSIAMTDNGWIKRNTIIWYKPNCMPSSADDRFTVDFEYLYFFVKDKKYWFEQQFDKYIWASSDKRSREPTKPKSGKVMTGQYGINKVRYGSQGRNKRCVWKITTQPFPEAHFAVYPEQLCYTPIKAGCPENGTVLDPFAGAGTTLLVAEKLRRKNIGIEISKEYCDIAVDRIKKETAQYKLDIV